MLRKILITIFLVAGGHWADAQFGPEKLAQNNLEKGKWTKAEKLVRKALGKDSLNAEARWIYAQWYFSVDNPDFNIDSAYAYTLGALGDFGHAAPRERDRMRRFPVDSALLLQFRHQVDSAAFDRAKVQNTEVSYNFFLSHFPGAADHEKAVELRDEVSFLDALKVNTYQSFKAYLEKYPDSQRAEEAKSRYEKLLFREKTHDGKLNSFLSFYKEFPNSPYRSDAEEVIFQVSTADGTTRSLMTFMKSFPESKWNKKARDLAYHILRQSDESLPRQILNDSLVRVNKLEQGYWVPFLKGGKYGFMDAFGKEVLSPRFDDIADDLLCGNILSDYIMTSAGVVGRSGQSIYPGAVKDVEEIGFGFLMIATSTTCHHIVHKSGWQLTADCMEDGHIVADRFLALKKAGKWGLMAFNGRLLLDYHYDAITSEEDIILLAKNGKKSLHTINEIAGLADQNSLHQKLVFDDCRKLGEGLLLVHNGALEGILDHHMQYVIPLDRQILTTAPYGFLRQINNNKFKTVGLSKVLDQEEYDEVTAYLNWVSLRQPDNLRLVERPSQKVIGNHLDSLWFKNKVALALKGDSLLVYLNSGKQLRFETNNNVTFIKSVDSLNFFFANERNKKVVYGAESGVKRFSAEVDGLEYLGSGTFLASKQGKKGLLAMDGKVILPLDYDAIVVTDSGLASLLKDRKFGLFDLNNRKLIKPAFERNVRPFDAQRLIAFQDGHYGFIGWDSKPLSDFEFDEVRPWNKERALVKMNFQWMIYDWERKEIVMGKIKDYEFIWDRDGEKLAIVHVEHDYGVISNTRGTIIPPTFSDIINVGSAEKPFYFTEKHVEEADIYIVIYYDETGKLVRKQVYEDDEYDRIYCREN